MRFLHLADLHIGKRVNDHLMLEDQEHVLTQVLNHAQEQEVEAVLVAGDVYDKPVPTQEALALGEFFFGELLAAGIAVYCIPGNHDSAQRLSHNSALVKAAGLHIARPFEGEVESVVAQGASGERVQVTLLPYLRPTDVRLALGEGGEDIKSYDDAVRAALETVAFEPGIPHVLVAHQFVVNDDALPQTCESEVLSVGGTDSVQASLFDEYDYVALGHLHGRQMVKRPEVRYCGTLLKYSFSEVNHKKSVTMVDVSGDGVSIEELPLQPLRDMREITASYDQLVAGVDSGSHEDYVRIVLEDRALYDAMAKVRALYPNVLRLDWEFDEVEVASGTGLRSEDLAKKSMEELFSDFYELQAGQPLSAEEREVLKDVFSEEEGVLA